MPDYAARWQKARRFAKEAGVDALYVMSGPNFRWFSGLVPHPGGWPLWAMGVLVPVDGEPRMIITQMHADLLDLETCPIKRTEVYMDGQNPVPFLKSLFESAGLKRGQVGVEDSLWYGDVQLIQDAVPDAKLRRTQSVFDELRSVKDSDEIDLLKRAAHIHDIGYTAAKHAIRAGATVGRAGLEIMTAMVDSGNESMQISGVFKTLSDRPFKEGDIVDVDLWPGSYGGYRADSARNVFVGEPSAEARQLYELTEKAYWAAVSVVKPGALAEDVHKACQSVIEEGGRKQVWKVGHGVGLNDGHEAPLLQPGNRRRLEEGMVFTIDPGVFIARDVPIHIEDTVVVTADGWQNLNAYTHDVVTV
jgi:Xaa-Pro aminopeptidase